MESRPNPVSRASAVRAFELSLIYGTLALAAAAAWSLDIPELWYAVALFFAVDTLLVLWYMPVRCASDGGIYKLCTPVRCLEVRVVEIFGEVAGGRTIPTTPRGASCWGWPLPTTQFLSCRDWLYFSTPHCGGRWMRIRGEVEGRQKEVWLCGCR